MARKFTRRRWRRPERMTLEHPPVVRRKDIGAPDLLTLEPELQRSVVRRKLAGIISVYLGASAIEGLAVALAARRSWPVLVFGGLAVIYAAAARRLGPVWIRRAMGAEPARNPRLNRLVRAVSQTAGVGSVQALIVRADRTNGFALAAPGAAVVATTGSLNVDDLVLEGLVAHEVVRVRDGEASLACTYTAVAGGPALLRRNPSPLLLLGLLLWPAALVVRASRVAWFGPDDLHRADVAAALLTRYPPGVETALRGSGRPPGPLRVGERFWFSDDAGRRADLIAEM